MNKMKPSREYIPQDDIKLRVRKAIDASGMSLADLARKLGISYLHLHRLVSNNHAEARNISCEQIAEIAQAIGRHRVDPYEAMLKRCDM